MKFTFLGTGTSQGVPVIGCNCEVCTSADPRDNRLRTSGMLEVDGQTIVFDTGPDFRQQMLRAKPDNVDAVLFTHEHKDHIAGMDDIRPFNFKNRKPLDVFAHERVQAALKREFHYVFAADKYPGVPQVNLYDIHTNQSFMVGKTKVEPIEVFHYKMPVLGFRIRNFAYVTDAKTIAPEQLEKLQGLDVLVLNALRKKEHISHFNLEQAVDLAEKLQPKRAFFTHISHFMGRHEEVSKELPRDIALAYDGLSIEMN